MAASTLPTSSLYPTRTWASERTGLAPPAKSIQDDVLARARAGDNDAFAELYLQHKKRVFSICLRMVHDFSEAEDLTQETFLKLHRKLASFRGDSAFTTWLHRITVNIVLMYLRKRVLPVVSLDHLMTNLPEEHIGRGVGTRDLTQIGVVDRLAIDHAAANLPPGYRRTFLLHDVHGFQHSEIASILDCTSGNSKSQLHKARRALRRALSTYTNQQARGHAALKRRSDSGRMTRNPETAS
ncbi:sigma-70 family RNA polymerase sigma factor [Telmatobacter sp. DSM 110680]|uniref:Sigma-70 family RNA polymerase sigma factor n=1 Tax=Telmatobacter sp. DSM 110680 TaxID=3036704 RepID=A0AAU7DMR7_9BACT